MVLVGGRRRGRRDREPLHRRAVGRPGEIVRSIFGTGQGLGDLVVELRAPRLCVALLAGACLAASGVVLQATVRNAFAGPELVGVTGGASVAAFVVLLVLPAAPRGALPLAAFAGGIGAMALVLVLAGSGRGSPQRLALVGLAVTAGCVAVTTLLVLNAEPAASVAITWLAGSTYAESWSELRLLAIPAAILLPIAALAVRRLDVLMLDDELGAALGLRVGLARASLLAVGRGARGLGGRGDGRDRVRRPARAARRAARRRRQPPPPAAGGDDPRRHAARDRRHARPGPLPPDRDPVGAHRRDDRRAVPQLDDVAGQDGRGVAARSRCVGVDQR